MRAEMDPRFVSLFLPVQMARVHPFVEVGNETNAKELIYDYGLNRESRIKRLEMKKIVPMSTNVK